jgi:hypothetical protein
MEGGSDDDETEDELLLGNLSEDAQRVGLVATVAVICYMSDRVIERAGNLKRDRADVVDSMRATDDGLRRLGLLGLFHFRVCTSHPQHAEPVNWCNGTCRQQAQRSLTRRWHPSHGLSSLGGPELVRRLSILVGFHLNELPRLAAGHKVCSEHTCNVWA